MAVPVVLNGRSIGKALRLLERACEVAVVGLLGLITVVILLGVYYRYVLNDALSWSEELARYLMIWMGFIGAGLVLKDESHIGMTVLRDALPRPIRWGAHVFTDLVVLLFMVVLCWMSWRALMIIQDDITSGLDIPMFWPFLVMPVGSALMIVHQLAVLPRHIGELRSAIGKAGGPQARR